MDQQGTPGGESRNIDDLSIAVIGPGDDLRGLIMGSLAQCHHGEVQEFPSYPPTLDDIPHLLSQKYDCILIELDSDPEYALKVIQTVCADGKSSVTLYSRMSESEIDDPDLLMRSMRMGAREFISVPFPASVLADALERAALRSAPSREVENKLGRLFVFCGTKGGVGVTNIACNFAIALAKQCAGKTVLVDLDLPLGDTALNLGIRHLYSTLDALDNCNRLDLSLLSKLLVWHESGLAVLPAPGQFPTRPASNDAIDQLLKTAREGFENVVVDSGAKLDLASGCAQFKDATRIYLVTQCGIPELRNANRLITRYMTVEGLRLEIVLNRYETGRSGISDDDIRKALTREISWRIPNDYRVVREMQDTSAPIIGTDSLIARRIDEMVRAACGLPPLPGRTRGFSFKGLFKRSAPRAEKTSLSATPLGISTVARALETEEAGGRRAAGEGERDLARRLAGREQELALRICDGKIYQRAGSGSWRVNTGADPALRALPAIEWSSPDPISYGTPLSDVQCNARASVPGKFRYTPGEGILLPAGGHTLWVTFTPDDQPFLEVYASTEISVMKTSAEIQWAMPTATPSGTALGPEQLNATASVAGTFEYTPPAGEVLNEGLHWLKARFTPADSNYMNAQVQVPLAVVEPGAPLIRWARPADIAYGTPLGAMQLNAAASVPGSFSYSPEEGTILPPGDHMLSAQFIPDQPTPGRPAHASVPITVNKSAAFREPPGRRNPRCVIEAGSSGQAPATPFPVTVTRTISMIAWGSGNERGAGDPSGEDAPPRSKPGGRTPPERGR